MIVLKATLTQKKALEGFYLNGAVLEFIQDLNNNWVVNESVLTDDNFKNIRTELEALIKIEYKPKTSEIL